MSNQVGLRLKMIRNVKRLSQKSFSEYLDINLRTYEKWEQGKRLPDLCSVIKIADRLEISIDWLVGRSDALTINHDEDIKKYFEKER